jgi:CBS domain containing-hemolysin-like protein
VLAHLGRIPSGGETFEFEHRRYTVLHMEGRRIARVKIESVNQPTSIETAI